MYFLHKPQSSALHRVFHPEEPSFLKHESIFTSHSVSGRMEILRMWTLLVLQSGSSDFTTVDGSEILLTTWDM